MSENKLSHQPRFQPGSIYITRAAAHQLQQSDVQTGLRRHLHGDWGDVCDEDRGENEVALREGYRLFSVYHAADGTRFWVITEADLSYTTVMLPEDY